MVSIIILSYNTKNLLRECLQSVYKHLASFDFEIIVIDNASSDKSAEMVKSEFKKVQLIQSDKNLGFSKGNNLGVLYAQGEYLFFLNSDTQLVDDSLKHIVEVVQTYANVGIVGGKLINPDKTIQRSCGNFYSLPAVFLMLFTTEKLEMTQSKGTSLISVDWISGACFFIPKKIFNEVKGFDENLFMYTEDVELCYRVRKKGYGVCYYPRMSILHAGQGSSNRTFAIIHIYKGLLYFYKKHKSYWAYIVVKTMLVVKAQLAISIGVLTHNKYLKDTYSAALKF